MPKEKQYLNHHIMDHRDIEDNYISRHGNYRGNHEDEFDIHGRKKPRHNNYTFKPKVKVEPPMEEMITINAEGVEEQDQTVELASLFE